VILRGGRSGPNYDSASLAAAAARLAEAGLPARVVVDASHANSGKDHVRQAEVITELAGQIAAGDPISGVMIESFLEPGRQNLTDAGRAGLVFGQSITDACLGWEQTETALDLLAFASARRGATPARTDAVTATP
jgi:3-deoxy-7-phosphoheptulonate synthase